MLLRLRCYLFGLPTRSLLFVDWLNVTATFVTFDSLRYRVHVDLLIVARYVVTFVVRTRLRVPFAAFHCALILFDCPVAALLFPFAFMRRVTPLHLDYVLYAHATPVTTLPTFYGLPCSPLLPLRYCCTFIAVAVRLRLRIRLFRVCSLRSRTRTHVYYTHGYAFTFHPVAVIAVCVDCHTLLLHVALPALPRVLRCPPWLRPICVLVAGVTLRVLPVVTRGYVCVAFTLCVRCVYRVYAVRCCICVAFDAHVARYRLVAVR